MTFLDSTFLDSSYLEESAARIQRDMPEVSASLPVPTAQAARQLAGQAAQAGTLGQLLEGTVTIPFVNITMTKKQLLFLIAVIAGAYYLWQSQKKKGRKG